MEQNYYVYKLYNINYPEFYIGSTKNIKARKACHKSNCTYVNNPCYNYPLYRYIRSNGGYETWSYEILEHIRNSINVIELRNLERKYIEELQPGLNIEIPNRTSKEWRQDNREQIIGYKKQYYENNREAINQKQNQYYENNRESINEKVKQKFNCECGGKYTISGKAKHMRTKKHRDFIN